MPLFNESDALSQVTQDLNTGLGEIFEGTDVVRAVDVFADEPVGTVSEAASVVAWEWPVVHVGHLQGTPPTGKAVTIRGITVIDGRSGELLFSRYIDWLGLYAQIGAVTTARPLVDDRRDIPENVPHPVPDP